MGGAVVVHATPLLLKDKYRVSGVAVLDVVEGTALDALPHMPAVLNSRPEGFDSISDAIEWQYVLSVILYTFDKTQCTVQYHCAPNS
jgi:protein phosphatase methylesterase 1